MYGVPLRSKYPNSEMLFQKQSISRDVQNMKRKIIIYRSRPKKKICTSSSSLFDEILDNSIFDGKIMRSRKFSMTSRIEKRVECKKKIRSRDFKSRDCERTLTSDIGDSVWEVDRPTRLLQFVAFVHLPFSFRSLDLFVASLLFGKGTSFCVIRRK